MRHFGDDMAPGDVFNHERPVRWRHDLPDIFIFKPLYHEGERLAFACTVCHHTDVGGLSRARMRRTRPKFMPRGCASRPMKLYEAGKLNKTIMTSSKRTSACRSRCSVICAHSLRPVIIAEKQFAEIVARYGPKQTTFYLKEIIDYASG